MKKLIATLLLCNFVTLVLWSQVPYGYAPASIAADDLSALGGNKNQFVQGLVKFSPAQDPVLQRLKGRQVKGVRCYVRADYKQARQKRSGILASEGSPDNLIRQTYADLTEGWNDVLFDEPYVIGDEDFYLGLQAYETIGTPYPLVAYAKATVGQSCYVNQAKKSWEEYADRGTLLVLALLDDDASEAFDHAVFVQNTTHPQTVAPDEDFTGGLYIHNFTPYPVDNIDIAMQGEGAAEPTYKHIDLPQAVEPYGSTVVTTQLRAGTTESTTATWTCWTTNVNKAVAQEARKGVTTLYVTKDNFQRVPIIEEFTSQRCVNCPQMAYYLDKALEQYDGPYVYLSHHSGFREDAFTTDPDREVLFVFGGYENEYNPAIMYNRAVLEGEDVIIQGIRDMSPTPYLEALTEAAQMPAMAEVNIGDEGSQVTVSGRIARDLVGKPLRLSCYLVEDGISTDLYPQTGMDDADAPADLKEVFRHNGVILHYYNADALGDVISTDAEGHYSVSFPQVEKKGFGGTARRLVALVYKVNKSDLRDNQVLNAAELALTSGISEMENEAAPSLKGWEGIYDLQGRKVLQDNKVTKYQSNQLPTLQGEAGSRLPKGIYIHNGKKYVVR